MEARVRRMARAPERFGPALARALDERAPFTRRAVGPDAVALRIGRALLPAGLFQGALRDHPIRFAVPRGAEPTTIERETGTPR